MTRTSLNVCAYRSPGAGRYGAIAVLGLLLVGTVGAGIGRAGASNQPEEPQQFGGTYSTLDARRRPLVDDWVARFVEATGQQVPAQQLYDNAVSLSSKTTFDAITHALMTTTLTDASGASLGDALSLIERVESVKGEIPGAAGDRQFRMYARLTAAALETLARSREFRRGADNTVYHRGYPINYRGQGGVPSIQFSVALDQRRADVDVDYRSSSFPAALFNGHLTSSNSDVRAGRNFDRHINRWTGFESWWRSFFGIRMRHDDDDAMRPLALPASPRLGKKSIDLMALDFFRAWLVEGDIVAAMGYIADGAHACLAQGLDDPATFDRGVAPYQLMVRLREASAQVGAQAGLEGVMVGVRFNRPGLKVVTHPRHAQFVLYAVPDDIAAQFDCESRLTLSDGRTVRRAYGHFYGATFNLTGAPDHTVALVWGQVNGYWKIVSWQTGIEATDPPVPDAPPDATITTVPAEASLVQAAHDFLDRWLVRRDYDGAFGYLSPRSYSCYALESGPDQPASRSSAEAGQRFRVAFQQAGARVAGGRRLPQILAPLEPIHPAVRLMQHQYSDTFTLTSLPTALADAAACDVRARGEQFPTDVPLDYGQAFGMNLRFRTRGGEAPVLRLLWTRENGAWRVTAFDVETP